MRNETQRTRSCVPLVSNVQLYPTGRLEPMNVKALPFYQIDKVNLFLRNRCDSGVETICVSLIEI